MDVTAVKRPPVEPVQASKRPEQVQQAKNQESKPRPPEHKSNPEAKPSPVINTQGQTTGRLLNVSA